MATRDKKENLPCDEWCKNLTPSPDLCKALHGETIDFTHFIQQYHDELNIHHDEGVHLTKIAQQQSLTLVYATKDIQHNHALVLADWLKNLT